MTDASDKTEFGLPAVTPLDVVNGLATADRSLLATALALFEDARLHRRLGQLYDAGRDKLSKLMDKAAQSETVAEVETSRDRWINSDHDNETLRLLLWIHLRDAFGLPARLAVSERSGGRLADDLAAAVVHHVDPPGLVKLTKSKLGEWGVTGKPKPPANLNDVVQPVLEALIKESEKAMESLPESEREKFQQEMEDALRRRLETMCEEDKQKLADMVGADKLNDAALRKILATTGGLTAFSLSVKMAGFSAYILAAKASAFIPLMSGPAVVSVVSVLSNPITVVAGSGLIAWWAVNRAGSKSRREVAVRVIALLALQGLGGKQSEVRSLLGAFHKANDLEPVGKIKRTSVKAYKAEWELLQPCLSLAKPVPGERVTCVMEQPATGSKASGSRLRGILFPGDKELANTAMVAGLTLGDVLYSAAAIDPTVMKAADFARVEDLSGTLSFADYARRIDEMVPEAYRGALSNLKGYTAEHVVAAQLVMQGHQVSFPEASNEAGWDLLVDGGKFQVKCVGHVSGITEHFEKYDYPVIANAELMDSIPKELADQVYFVDGFTDELVSHVTESAIADGADVFSPDVPLFAITASLLRNFMECRQGKVTAQQAAEQFVVDGTARAVLGTVGHLAGASLGLLFFGPAGALVFGVVMPVFAQAQARRVRNVLKEAGLGVKYQNWAKEMESAMNVLSDRLQAALDEKQREIVGKKSEQGDGAVSSYVVYRLGDDAVQIEEQRARLLAIKNDAQNSIEVRGNQLLAWISRSSVFPHWYQAEIKAFSAVCKRRPGGVTQAADVAKDAAARARDAGTKVYNSLKSRVDRYRKGGDASI